MNKERWKTVNEIFHAALECPQDERSAFVCSACNGDRTLESDVRRLLEADDQAESFLETPILSAGPIFGEYSSPSPLQAGDTLKGRYRIIEPVGEGGMGHVFKAFDRELNVTVALKVIRAEVASNPAALEFFRREVRTARAITHPNVCRTYDLDRGGPQVGMQPPREFYFFTMEFLEGETLSALLKRTGHLNLREALVIANQVASALDAAHAMGIIHRDIKPSNIMLVNPGNPSISSTRAVITDFGCARYGSSASSIGLGNPVGTLAYMAPEQLQSGGPISPATDIYAFGLVLFEMVTGSRPLPSPHLVNRAISIGDQCSPQVVLPPLPERWGAAIRRCLQINPDDRFHSAAEIMEALSGTAVVLPEIVASDSDTHVRHTRHFHSWKRVGLIAAFVIAAVALSLMGLRLFRSKAYSEVEPGALIYLAPIKNDTEEMTFDNITELIRAGLNQSGQMRLLDQESVGNILQQMARDPGTRIDQSTGREIAMRAGAVRAIFPTVTGSGGNYELTIDIQKPDNSPLRYRRHSLRSFGWRSASPSPNGAIPGELLDAVRTAENWIRTDVGEAKNDIARLDVPPEDATTGSWAALDEYAQARKLILVGRRQDAVTALNRAVSLDPQFALAYAMRGDLLFSLHREVEGRESYNKALDVGLDNRLTRRDEDRIHGMRAIDAGDYEIAVDVFHDLALNYPKSLEGWVYPTVALRMLNRNDEAIANLRQAVALDPEASFGPYALAQELLIEGRTEEVRKWIDYLRQHNHPENADELDSIELFLAHKYEEARRALAPIRTSPNPMRQSYSYRDVAYLDAENGNDKDAMDELDRGMLADKEHGDQEQYAAKLLGKAYLECRLGQYENCLKDESTGYRLSPTLEHALAADAVLDLAIVGCSTPCTARLRQELREILHGQSSNNFGRRSEEVKLRTRGELQLAEGHPQDALRTMTTAAIKDTSAGNRDYLAHALLAGAKVTDDKGKVRVLLLRAQAAYTAVALHPSLVRCDPGDFPPGAYGNQLEDYVRVSQTLHDHSETVRKAEKELVALRPQSALASICGCVLTLTAWYHPTSQEEKKLWPTQRMN